MELEFFSKQIDRLKDVYGEKQYPPERAALLFTPFRTMHNELFKQMVDHLIVSCRSAPILKDFMEAVDCSKKQRDKNISLLPLRIRTTVSCDKCFRYFDWFGTAQQLSDDNNLRLCDDCLAASKK